MAALAMPANSPAAISVPSPMSTTRPPHSAAHSAPPATRAPARTGTTASISDRRSGALAVDHRGMSPARRHAVAGALDAHALGRQLQIEPLDGVGRYGQHDPVGDAHLLDAGGVVQQFESVPFHAHGHEVRGLDDALGA